MPRRKAPQRLTDAQRQLAEKHMPLVGYTLNKYFTVSIPRGEWDDFCSIGNIALCHAAAHYRSDIGPFAPYAIQSIRRIIHREFADRYRAKRKHDALITLDEWTDDDRPLEAALSDRAPGVELLVSLHIAMNALQPVERDVLQRRMDGEKPRDIAASIGCTRQAVEWRLKKAREHLKEQIAM